MDGPRTGFMTWLVSATTFCSALMLSALFGPAPALSQPTDPFSAADAAHEISFPIDLGSGWYACKINDQGSEHDCADMVAGQSWESQGWEDYDGHAVYRRQLNLVHADHLIQTGLYLGQIRDTDRVLLNGVEIGSTGREPPAFEKANLYHRLYTIPASLVAHDGENLLEVFIYNDSRDGGLETGSARIDDWFVLDKARDDAQTGLIIIITILGFIAVNQLLLYLFSRSTPAVLLFGVSCLLYCLYLVTYSEIPLQQGWNLSHTFRLNVALFHVIVVTFLQFFIVFFDIRIPTLLNLYFGYLLIIAATVFLVPFSTLYMLLEISETLFVIVNFPLLAWLLYKALKNRVPHTITVMVAILIHGLCATWDVLADLSLLPPPVPSVAGIISPISLVLFCTVLSIVLGQRHWRYYRTATYDDLTRALRRGAFEFRLENMISHLDSERDQLLMAMIDLDYFKTINDVYGHIAGDLLLKDISRRISRELPDRSLICRYGGDEFCIATIVQTRHQARTLLKQLQQVISDTAVDVDRKPVSTSATIGAKLHTRSDDMNVENILVRPDELLLDAKSQERGSILLQ